MSILVNGIKAKNVVFNGKSALVVQNKASKIIFGVQGVNWTASNVTGIKVYKVFYSYQNDVWVAATEKGLYYSADGKTWIQSNITTGIYSFVGGSALVDDKVMIALSKTSKPLLYSEDGKTWTASNVSFASPYGAYNYDGLWVAFLYNNSKGCAYYSEDGKTWTLNSKLPFINFCGMYATNGLWVAATEKGLYYSADGKTWTVSNVSEKSFLGGVLFANGLWVAAGDGVSSSDISTAGAKALYYSTDGKTWTVGTAPRKGYSGGLSYAKGLWFVCGYCSADGKTWKSCGGGGDYRGVQWNTYSDLLSDGKCYSADGKTWKSCVNSAWSGVFTDIDSSMAFNQRNGLWVISNNEGLYYSEQI